MRYDEYLSHSEIKLINQLQNKNRMEQDEILGNFHKKESVKNGKL